MKLVKQDIGVWVDIQEPIPIGYNALIAFDNGEIKMLNDDDMPFAVATHWLKPLEQVYVLAHHDLFVTCQNFYRFLASNGYFHELTNDFVEQGLDKCTEQYLQALQK